MISVVLPARNAAATLPAALASLAAQTLPDFEVIVVDDGSDDGGATRAVAAAFAGRDSRFRLLSRPHGGIVAALEAGVAAARGSAIARMDADDVCHPERLRLQARHLADNPQVGLVSCRVAFGGNSQAARGYQTHIDWCNSVTTSRDIRLGIFRESPLPHPSVLFRRELLARHGGYRHGDFPEDYELWLRWLEAGVVMDKLPEVLLTWNDPPGRLSRADPRYQTEAFFRIKAGYLARCLARINPFHPRVVVAGAGRITRRRAERLLAHGIVIEAWLDIDPDKVGKTVAGRPVVHLHDVPGPQACFVLPYVASRGATEYIIDRLQARGFVIGQNCLPAA
ncbi:Glycosyl transferase, group 2 family protein [Desulfovibrio sp. DV]|uniref:glycosyltransferase family 2 protein n=1 Tax=Desulfovibrio sp. DV TaxID=1844708 RepID=UPI00094BB830|nr:glycosyltransferase family 2 protein [Desulfovibrio sp. DV]OLN25337.1 Glycosyl transferase, group 2 family protein [Desulfovibrio sp. DV]